MPAETKPRMNWTTFRRWLEQDPGQIVGETHACNGCPLAIYWTEARGFAWASIGAKTTDLVRRKFGASVTIQNAPKTRALVNGIDALHSRVIHSPVTAREVLAILDRLEGVA